MSTSEESLEQAVLVCIDFNNSDFQEELREFQELVKSSHIHPAHLVTTKRSAPDSKFYIGTGKVDEIKSAVLSTGAKIIIFNHDLSPAQERNLERACQCRVLSRVGLILDIFALRARSYEGKLQVELAQLRHLSTRLIRGWTHLERQKGGIGLRGPGETQLETDRRLIGQRIKYIRSRLDKVRKQRDQSRRKRLRSDIPTVSLVGYTNAGKSTLFNALTDSGVYAADQLFATLDPTLRKLQLDGERNIVLSDTVGFIRSIPHDLIDAFHATLQEVRDADLLLHIIDVNDPERASHIAGVNEVIREIGAGDVPQVEVYNKIDLNESITDSRTESDSEGVKQRIWLSAKTGQGLDDLKTLLKERVAHQRVCGKMKIPASAGKFRSRLFSVGAVVEEQIEAEGGWLLDINIEKSQLKHFCDESGLECNLLQ